MKLIYWIMSIGLMFVLLITVIYNFIDSIKRNKEFKEINKKQLEWLDKQIESEDK